MDHGIMKEKYPQKRLTKAEYISRHFMRFPKLGTKQGNKFHKILKISNLHFGIL